MALFRSSENLPPIVPPRGWSAWLTTTTSAAMAFLAVLCLTLGIAAGKLADAWETDLASIATVTVAPPEDLSEAAFQERLSRAKEVLRTTRGIASYRELSDAEHAALLRPWLGDNADIAGLPTPRLIELELEADGPDGAFLQSRLDQSAPGAVFDAHQAWREPLARAADGLQTLAWTGMLVVTLSAGAMIGLSAQATLAANAGVVKTIRLIGAEDRFIARAFTHRLAIRGLIGGALGTAAGIAGLALLPRLSETEAFGIDLGPDATGMALLVIGVPLGAMAVASLAARLAVRMELRRLD